MESPRNLKKLLLVPAVLLATGLSGVAFAQQSASNDDTSVVAQVKSALAADATLHGANLKVDTRAGRIVLSGDATEDQAAEAYRAAVSAAGPKVVMNFISMTDIGG